jgi:tetratricopeptide (TPR) repeat protein
VQTLKEELSPSKSNVIALWGGGGVGKTALAAEVARGLADVFAQRIVWCSADGHEDFGLSSLLDEITTQLGRPDLRPLPLKIKTEQAQSLILAGPTLIILDHFETIKPLEQMPCVDFLLNRASCPALITTRQRIDSARNVTIAAMSPPEADEFLQRLIMQASDPSAFVQVDRDRIMEASERNPLVLQWAMAQIDLAQEANVVLDELEHGAGDAAQRVFDRSFGLEQLGDDGRDALLALCLFAPDASRPQLAETAGFDMDLKRLNEAVRRLASLLLVRTTSEGQRLTVEGLTRELAKAQLSKDKNADDFRKRFIACFLRYAETHKKPTPEDFDALEIEKENLLNAIDMAVGVGDWRSVTGIRSRLEEFLDLHGYWEDAILSGKQALQAAAAMNSEGEVAAFAHNLAVIHQRRGDYEEARRLYNESRGIYEGLGNQMGIAGTLQQLGRLSQSQGEFEEARRLYNESLEIAKKLGNQNGIAISLRELGTLAQNRGELEEARRLYNQSLEIDKKLGNQNDIASTLRELGTLAQSKGEIEEARRLYDESLAIKKKLGDQSGIATSLHQLAMLAQDAGGLDEARQLYQESLEIAKKLGDQSGIGATLHQLARLAEDEGKPTEAAQLFREALAIFEKLRSPNADIARESLERVKGKQS